MITNGFTYVAVIVFFASLVVFLEKSSKSKIFNYLPAIVIIYFTIMLLSTFGLWEKTDDVNSYYKSVRGGILNAMIFLMLLRADLRQIAKLGPKMIIGFFAASLTIALGFVVTYALFKNMYTPGAWKAFAALAGSWMGGTGNMVAIQGALDVKDADMGYTLLIDSIDYAIWVMILLAFVPYAKIFNRFTKADDSALREVTAKLEAQEAEISKEIEFPHMMILLGTSLLVSALSQYLSAFLPQTSFLSATTWGVILATIAGISLGMTAFGKIPGSNQIANVMLYILVGLIASRANFGELTQAPLYIFSGFVILAIHALSMLIIAKIFKLDLFTCGLASLANIGGVASAPILAASYGKALIPVGVLMAMLGYIIGTGGGLLIGKILSLL